MDNGASSYRRFLAGDESAFGELYDLYQDSLIFFLYRYVRNYTVAEDLAADSFAVLIAEPKKYNFSVSLKTYLYTVGRNFALNWLRHNRRFQVGGIEDAEEIADVQALEEQVLADERKRRISEAIDLLNDDYRTVIHLIFFEDMSYEEAGRVMKKSKKQIDNLLYRAKNALRAALGEEGYALL